MKCHPVGGLYASRALPGSTRGHPIARSPTKGAKLVDGPSAGVAGTLAAVGVTLSSLSPPSSRFLAVDTADEPNS